MHSMLWIIAHNDLQEVEAEYCIANGHTHNAEVIYGDTDSVMVRFGPTELAKVMAMGTQIVFSMKPRPLNFCCS
jgi:DNA polymerase elongation subunit (family B)